MIFINDILVLGFTYLFMTAYEHALHNLSHHSKYNNRLYQWHKLHHIDYPPHRLQTKIYKNSGGSIEQNLYLYMICTTSCLIYCVSSSRVFFIYLIETTSYILMIDYFHRQYHILNSPLNKYAWFRKNKEYHLHHHKKLHTNMNFVDSTFDKFFNTYSKDITASNDSHNPNNL